MTVFLSCHELARDGNGSGNQQEYVREFEVRMDDGLGSVSDAVTATGIAILSPHPENAYALAYKAKATQDKANPQFWAVTIDYKTFGRTFSDEERFTEPNPISRLPEVSIGNWNMRVPVPTDRDGAMIRNSAKQVPDPRLEADVELPMYMIKANVYPLPDWIDTYKNKYGRSINAARFKVQFQNGQYKTIEKGCARLAAVSASALKIENGQRFFEVAFSLMCRDSPPSDSSKDGWCFDMIDQGRMELLPTPFIDSEVGLGTALMPIQGQDGQPINDPWLLTGDGLSARPSLGDWSSGTAYSAMDLLSTPPTFGDVVTRNDVDYYCILDNTGDDPETNPTKWRKLPHILYWDYLKADDFTKLPACSSA